MSIWEAVSEGIKEAMRARDKERTSALRNIRAALLETAKKDGSESLGDDACTEVLRRLAKQRRESIDAYAAGGRSELVAEETAELAVIEGFLPRLADEETTRDFVAAAIAACEAAGPRDLGKVIGLVMRDHRAEVDGGLVRRVAAKMLGA